jgi:hypothetical protein
MAIITLPFPQVTAAAEKHNSGDTPKVISIEEGLGVVFLPGRHTSAVDPRPGPEPDDGDAA